MNQYPYLVYRPIAAFYVNRPVTIVGSQQLSESGNGIVVRWDGKPYDEDHKITPECREVLRAVGRQQQQSSGMRVCMVYAPDDCDYFEPDGSIEQSQVPPSSWIETSEGDYFPEIIVDTVDEKEVGDTHGGDTEADDTEAGDIDEGNIDLGPTPAVAPIGEKDASETVKLLNNKGTLLAEFDDMFWTFYHGDRSTYPVFHDTIVESPYYLIRELESIGADNELLSELSKKSKELKGVISSFRVDKRRLDKRIILFENEGTGAMDHFVDMISLIRDGKNGFYVETTIAGDPYDFPCNAFGEILVGRCDNVSNAEQLFDAINEVTVDDRWESIELSWDEIVENLRPHFPRLARGLARIVKQEER